MIDGAAGSVPVSAVIGFTVFLAFLLTSVQVLTHLYATSTVTAAAFDAARLVAGQDGVDEHAAEQHARALLGDYGRRPDLRFDWTASTPSEVVVQVEGPTPASLIQVLAEAAGLDAVRREIRVHREAFR